MKPEAIEYIKKHELPFWGITGFVFGVLLIVLPSNTFHEIEYRPRDIVRAMLSDTNKISGYHTYDSALKEEICYRSYLLSNLSDSLCEKFLFAGQLYINRDDFDSMSMLDFDKATCADHKRTLPFTWDYYIDSSLSAGQRIKPARISMKVSLEAHEFPRYMDFFKEYPAFILWVLLIIIQFPVFLFLASFANTENKKFRALWPAGTLPQLKGKIISATFIVSVFVTASYITFFMTHPIMGGLFCSKFYVKLLFALLFAFAGIAGTVCFAGFMVISEFNVETVSGSLQLSPGPEGDKERAHIYNAVNKLFNRMLSCVSIALSLIVLATGALFNALNSMEFIKKVSHDFGHSPVAFHFVFMVGILCSGLILLFFFPAKMHLMRLQKEYKATNPEGKGIEQPERTIEMIKTLLTVGMPALIPVLHFVLGMFY